MAEAKSRNKSFAIDPDTLYSMTDLEGRLDGLIGLDTLLNRLRLRNGRVFKGAVFGFEILEAARKAEAFSEPITAGIVSISPPRGRVGSSGAPVRKLGAADLENLEKGLD